MAMPLQAVDRRHTVAFDLETIPDKSVIDYLPEIEVKTGNLKDPEKIKAKKEQAEKQRLEKMGLIHNQNMICCFSFWNGKTGGSFILHEMSATGEKKLIKTIWQILERYKFFITFNGHDFDLPILLTHTARYGLKQSIRISPNKYQVINHLDCYQFLSNHRPMQGSLDYYAKWFGLETGKNKGITGADIHDLYQKKDFSTIKDYCLNDAKITYQIGDRIAQSMCL